MDKRKPTILGVDVSSRGITDLALKKVAKHIGIKNLDGIVMKEEFMVLPYPKKKVIVNLGDNGIGTHWVLIYRKPGVGSDYIYYFDSYGLGMPDAFRSRFDDDYVIESMSTIQSYDSLLCGLYCIYFIKEMDKGRKMREILLDFGNRKEELQSNDSLLIKYFDKYNVSLNPG